MALADDERMEILQLLADGKITVDEASFMLSGAKSPKSESPSLEESIRIDDPADYPAGSPAAKQTKVTQPTSDVGSEPKWFHVRVSDLGTGKGKVTVNIPWRFVKFGLSIGRHFSPELNELDWTELSKMLGSERGVLVDVEDEEDGEHVQIYVD